MDRALRQVAGLRILDPMPQVWWEAQAHFGDFLSRWSPQGLLGRMGEALVELQGTTGLFGPPQDAAIRMQRELASRVGWASHGGLSQSATAARIGAHLEHQMELVREGAERAFLAPCPLGKLPEVSPRLQWRFHRLGLRRFGDLQPVPLPTLARLMPESLAKKVLTQVRGEDRPRLPMLAEPPGESSRRMRLEPPRLPHEVFLAAWCLEHFWLERRSPRTLTLRWWDVDGEMHRWMADPPQLALPPMELAQVVEQAFRKLSLRRILIHRLELHMAWGLGRARALFESPLSTKLNALEPILAGLRRRYPQNPVLPGWVRRAEGLGRGCNPAG